MPDITTRAEKGSPLLNAEMDANLVALEAPVMEVWVVQGASFNAAAKGRYVLNGAGIVVTLPAAPPNNTEIWLRGNFKTQNATVARGGATIAGVAEDLILDLDHIMPKLVYWAGDWQVSQ